jgi:hypothetical protein
MNANVLLFCGHDTEKKRTLTASVGHKQPQHHHSNTAAATTAKKRTDRKDNRASPFLPLSV